MVRAAEFLGPLDLEFIPKGKGDLWIVRLPLKFYSAQRLRTYTVPSGFVTDLASVPRGLWNIFPKSGKYNRATGLHDGAYNDALIDCLGNPLIVPKKDADALFLEAMLADGVSETQAKWMYRAVKLFGRKRRSAAKV